MPVPKGHPLPLAGLTSPVVASAIARPAEESGAPATGAAGEQGLNVGALLRALFAGDGAAARFVVLRNGELLPHAMAGNDLDVATLPGISPDQVVAFLVERARPLGWAPVCLSRRADMTAFSLVDLSASPPRDALHVDVFNGIRVHGVRLLPPELLAAESVVRDGVRQLTPRARVLATLAHHAAASGALTKDKYLTELVELQEQPEERAWLLARTAEWLGHALVGELAAPGGPTALRTPSRRRRWRVLASAARSPWGLARMMLRYCAGQLPSLVHPSGVVGRRGDRFGAPPHLFWLSPELACRVSPLAMIASSVRAAPEAVYTLNGAKHQRCITEIWRAATPLRLFAPSLFLWLQAKRNRIVVLDRLPLALRALRRVAAPVWLATPAGSDPLPEYHSARAPRAEGARPRLERP